MTNDHHRAVKRFSSQPANNSAIFISVVMDDPELLEAARSEGFVIFPESRDAECLNPEIVAIGDSYAPTVETIGSGSTRRVDDNSLRTDDTKSMTDMTREELSITLSALEERMDKRVERMEKDSVRRSDDIRREMRLRERSARRESIAMHESLQAHIQSNDKAVSSTLAALERTEQEFGKVRQANKEQRYWMAGIGVAIVLGIMGANATIFSGGKSFFDGGKEAVQNQKAVDVIIQKAQEQTDANRRVLDEIKAFQLSVPKQQSGK